MMSPPIHPNCVNFHMVNMMGVSVTSDEVIFSDIHIQYTVTIHQHQLSQYLLELSPLKRFQTTLYGEIGSGSIAQNLDGKKTEKQ